LRSFHQTLRHRTAPCWTVRRVQGVEADECAGQVEEPEQDVRAPLVADLQPPVADQPRQRPLHHVPVAAQPLARLDAAPGDPGRDAARAQRQTAARVVCPPLSQCSLAGRLRGRPGRPRGPLTGGRRRPSAPAASSRGCWRPTALRPAGCRAGRPAGGTWSRAGRGLSGSGRSGSPPFGAHAQAVQAGPQPVELALAAELVQQHVVELLPHAGALPVAQPPPAGDRAAAAELVDRQQPSGDAGAQLVDDAGQAGAVVDAGPAP
jgi:hypothetical protein